MFAYLYLEDVYSIFTHVWLLFQVIKPDGYNGFEVISNEQAQIETIQKQQESEAKTKSGK